MVFVLMYMAKVGLAQITPPAMGKVNAGQWTALGVQQQLDTAAKFISMTYVGVGHISGADNYNMLQRTSHYVANQELTHRVSKHWKYAVALSYRWQNRYVGDTAEQALPRGKQEMRFYTRGGYSLNKGRMDFSALVRQELRVFLTPTFQIWEDEVLQLRSRIRLKSGIFLSHDKKHKLLLGAELLFAASASQIQTLTWGAFDYRETRFTCHYAFSPAHFPITLHVGYMNVLQGTKQLVDSHYLGLDLILRNPFEKKR